MLQPIDQSEADREAGPTRTGDLEHAGRIGSDRAAHDRPRLIGPGVHTGRGGHAPCVEDEREVAVTQDGHTSEQRDRTRRRGQGLHHRGDGIAYRVDHQAEPPSFRLDHDELQTPIGGRWDKGQLGSQVDQR